MMPYEFCTKDELIKEIDRLRGLLDLPRGCKLCGGIWFKLEFSTSQWDDDDIKCLNCGKIVYRGWLPYNVEFERLNRLMDDMRLI